MHNRVNIDRLLTQPDALYARVRAALAADHAALRSLPPGVRRAAVLLLLVNAGGAQMLRNQGNFMPPTSHLRRLRFRLSSTHD